VDLLAMPEQALRGIRGQDIAMIFQEPMTALNPLFTVGEQIAEVLQLKQGLDAAQCAQAAVALLSSTGIAEAARRAKSFPHQLSGGQRQRAMIAMALACNPEVLIADEPTSALDVTIQAQILEVIAKLRRELGTAVILITHDLGVVAETAERVIVMYAGRKVEEGAVGRLFASPLHPYTRGLINSIPRLALMRRESAPAVGRLQEIPGMVPALSNLPPGCTFAPRCSLASDACRREYPPYEEKLPDQFAACWHTSPAHG
jgi:peptide/nickel transport system ATP-binding protein